MERVEIQASNIKCDGCVNAIIEGLTKKDTSLKVEVDIESNVVSIVAAKIDRKLVEQTLQDLGYPAT